VLKHFFDYENRKGERIFTNVCKFNVSLFLIGGLYV
jgi:hypothetical protein